MSGPKGTEDLRFPSLEDPPEFVKAKTGHGWIQWKGTDVCIDLHCRCGAWIHFDGDFLYFFTCGKCGQAFEIGGHVKLYPVDHPSPDAPRLGG